jgi:RNA polymerase sigma-70 factor (ECF subfamily)
MTADLSDDMLMQRYCEGDSHAFRELYLRHADGLYRFIAWKSPRKDWADEVFQESWAALHNARAKYTPQAAFRTYLYQIAKNRLIDLMRQHQLVLASELGHADEGEEAFSRLADQMSESDSPETILSRKQQASGLRAAIDALPSEQKEVLVMQQFNDMSLDEIARLAHVPVETVKSRLRYAMRKLRQHFAERADEQGEPV